MQKNATLILVPPGWAAFKKHSGKRASMLVRARRPGAPGPLVSTNRGVPTRGEGARRQAPPPSLSSLRRQVRGMSHSGQTRPKWPIRPMSALTPIATKLRTSQEVSFVPTRDSCTAASGAFHSITSSASASIVGGTVSPSALAVFRLITNSNLTGCCTGKSPGFSPLRMRSTYEAARRY